jgi:hypothetical protein
MFENKKETTPSGWDKNRAATSCKEYKEKNRPAETETVKVQ